jgi:hypothetical protein
VAALVKRQRLRRALDWTRAHRRTRHGRLRLAVSLCSYRGRFVARAAFTGIRDLEALRRLVSLRGAEHLVSGQRGMIFLGFHLGPPNPDVALRMAGQGVTWIGPRGNWIGGARHAAAWPPELHRLYEGPGEHRAGETALAPRGRPPQAHERAVVLYRARQILRGGGSIFITADGPGVLAFEVPLPGGPARIRAGWLLLREATGAPVLPVMAHMEGRIQVVTVHPPLPPLDADPVRDAETCREALGRLLVDHVRQFPEQGYLLAFGDRRS